MDKPSRWHRIRHVLLTGWGGIGHLTQARELGTWIYRAVVVASVLAAGLSLAQGLWGLVLVLLGIALALAVFAYFRDRPNRADIWCQFLAIAPLLFRPEGEAVAIFLRVMNRGKPTVLTGWSVSAVVGGVEYKLDTPMVKLAAHGRNVDTLRVTILDPAVSLPHATLAPVGLAPVTGYVWGATKQLSRSDLDSAATRFVVRFRDAFNRNWAYRSSDEPYERMDGLPPIAGLTS